MIFTPAFLKLFGDFLNTFFRKYGGTKKAPRPRTGRTPDLDPVGGRGMDPTKAYNINTSANSSWVGEIGWVPTDKKFKGNIWIRPEGYPKSYVFPSMPWTFYLDLTSPGLNPGDGPGRRLWRGGKLGTYYGVDELGVEVDTKIRDVADIFQSEVTTAGSNYNKLRKDFGYNRLPSALRRR